MCLLDVSVHTFLKLFFIQHYIAAFTLNRKVYNEKEMIFVKKYIYMYTMYYVNYNSICLDLMPIGIFC